MWKKSAPTPRHQTQILLLKGLPSETTKCTAMKHYKLFLREACNQHCRQGASSCGNENCLWKCESNFSLNIAPTESPLIEFFPCVGIFAFSLVQSFWAHNQSLSKYLKSHQFIGFLILQVPGKLQFQGTRSACECLPLVLTKSSG